MLRALDARRSPHDEPAYRAWLFRIMRNAFIDKCRRSGVDVASTLNSTMSDDDEAGWCGDRRIIDVLTVRFAVAKLPPAHREIIGLVDFVGLSYQEAADVLGVAARNGHEQAVAGAESPSGTDGGGQCYTVRRGERPKAMSRALPDWQTLNAYVDGELDAAPPPPWSRKRRGTDAGVGDRSLASTG